MSGVTFLRNIIVTDYIIKAIYAYEPIIRGIAESAVCIQNQCSEGSITTRQQSGCQTPSVGIEIIDKNIIGNDHILHSSIVVIYGK